MKKSLFLLLLLLTVGRSGIAQEVIKTEKNTQEEIKQKDKGEMKFEKTRHNFGVLLLFYLTFSVFP